VAIVESQFEFVWQFGEGGRIETDTRTQRIQVFDGAVMHSILMLRQNLGWQCNLRSWETPTFNHVNLRAELAHCEESCTILLRPTLLQDDGRSDRETISLPEQVPRLEWATDLMRKRESNLLRWVRRSPGENEITMLGQALHLLSKYTVKDRSRSRMSIRPMTRVSSRDSGHKHKPLPVDCQHGEEAHSKDQQQKYSATKPGSTPGLFSWGYFTRRPLKKPAFVVFCLILAVSPCSAVFTSAFVFHLFAYFGIVTGALWLDWQSRFRKSEQDDKWSFCLTTAIVAVNRRNHEQTTRDRKRCFTLRFQAG